MGDLEMTRLRQTVLFTALAFAVLFGAAFGVKAQPAQWGYSVGSDGVALATYPGNVKVNGSYTPGSGGQTISCVSAVNPCLKVSPTWNNGALAYTGLQVNATDTSSLSTSLLADLQVGGVSKFNVQKDGQVSFGSGGTWTFFANGNGASNGALNMGIIRGGNNGVTALTLGGTGGVSAIGNFVWATDNTGDIGASGANRPRNIFVAGQVVAGSLIYTGVTTVGSLPTAASAGAGARYFVSDSNVVAAGNFGNVVAAGGTNKVPVYSDGTNWRIG